MADNRDSTNRDNQAATSGSDSDSALREELRREEEEASKGIGDIAKDRNLSGSSSWLTDPPQAKGSDGADEDRSRK